MNNKVATQLRVATFNLTQIGGAMIRIDWCREDVSIPGNPEKVTQSGNIEELYPVSEWKRIGSCYSSGIPDGEWMENMEEKGASVAAYGGGNAWFALARR